jgi:hypothetical protein
MAYFDRSSAEAAPSIRAFVAADGGRLPAGDQEV